MLALTGCDENQICALVLVVAAGDGEAKKA